MEKKKVDNFLKIIELNDLIDKMYKKLADLEIKNASDEEMEEVIDCLKSMVRKEDKLLRNSMFTEAEISDLISLSTSLNTEDDDFLFLEEVGRLSNSYFFPYEDYNIKIKRFLMHCSEELTYNHRLEDDQVPVVNINGVDYPYEYSIELLENNGYQEFADKVKERFESMDSAREEFQVLNDNTTLIQNSIEAHYTLQCLEAAIANTSDEMIYKYLVKYKYMLIATIRSLETTFLAKKNNMNEIERLNKELKEYTKFGLSLDRYYKFLGDTISDSIEKILDRRKERYNSFDEVFKDIIAIIKINSYYLMIDDPKIKNDISMEQELALSLSPTELDRHVISSLALKRTKKDLSKN